MKDKKKILQRFLSFSGHLYVRVYSCRPTSTMLRLRHESGVNTISQHRVSHRLLFTLNFCNQITLCL